LNILDCTIPCEECQPPSSSLCPQTQGSQTQGSMPIYELLLIILAPTFTIVLPLLYWCYKRSIDRIPGQIPDQIQAQINSQIQAQVQAQLEAANHQFQANLVTETGVLPRV